MSQLRMSDMKLTDRQQQAIHTVYDRNDVFFLPSSGGVCYHFLFDDRNGLLGGQKFEEMLSQAAC